jgi:tetratricopeptide (TPR) repeat protein
MKTVDELWRLLNEARRMPYGSAQIALVEQVLRHSDAVGDRDLSFSTRMFATSAYVYGGEVAKSFVTFSWCLSDFDCDPAPFHRRHVHTLLWHFKYMVTALTKFPEVPLDRTYAVLDDMERRYREGGHSLQAVDKHRFLVARHIGDEPAADLLYDRWNTASRDDLSDCAGCDPSSRVTYLSDRGRYDEAIALAEPVLAGRLTCTEQPQNILLGLLVPYLRTGRLDAAADAHRRSYRLIRGNLADLWDIGDHMEFCARTGNEHRGLEILQRHVDWLDRAPSPAAGMAFAAAASLLLRRLTETGHGALTVHRREHGDRPAADVPASVLAGELAAYATELSLRFDARNGTPEQGRRIAEVLSAQPYDVVLPLSPTARRAAPAAPPAPAVPAAPVAEIPADADAATLLDLADGHQRSDDDALAVALAAFDTRFGGVDLGPELAARRAEFLSAQRRDVQDADGSMAALEQAVKLYKKAGNAVRASNASGALGLMRVMTGKVRKGRGMVADDVKFQEKHGDLRRRAASLARLAMTHMVQQESAEALAAQDRADAVAAQVGDPRLVARHAMRRAFVLAELHRHEEAAASAGQARDFFRAHGSPAMFAASSITYARSLPDQEAAAVAFGEAAAVRDPDTVLDALMGRAGALTKLERPGDAVHDLVEAVAVCAERGLVEPGAFIRHQLAIAYRDAGRMAEAAEVAEEAIGALEGAGHAEAADDARFVLAGVYRELGESEPALALYDALAERVTKAGNHSGLGQVQEFAADLLFRLDRDAQAAERFAAAADAYRSADEPLDELRMLRRRVAALHWADDLPAGLDTVRFAVSRHIALAGRIGGQPPVVWERSSLDVQAADLLMSRGRYADALPYLTGTPERFRSIGATDDADHADGMLGEALLRSGRPAEAEVLLRRTLAGMGPDAPTRAVAAKVLAETLDALGRTEEAGVLRSSVGLDPTE